MAWIDWPAEKKIAVSHKIRSFMADEDIQTVFSELETRYINDLIAGDNSEARSKAHARVHAFRAVMQELKAAMDSGDADEALQELKTQRAEFQKKHGLLS